MAAEVDTSYSALSQNIEPKHTNLTEWLKHYDAYIKAFYKEPPKN